jgi:hypothetical protein
MRWCFLPLHIAYAAVKFAGSSALSLAAAPELRTNTDDSLRVLQRLDAVNERFTQLESSVQQLIGKLSSQEQRQQFKHDEESSDSSWWSSKFTWVRMLFVHEVWVMLQHLNVLCNPLCQRLDRRYGIALLKRKLYWVIAGIQSLLRTVIRTALLLLIAEHFSVTYLVLQASWGYTGVERLFR